VTSVVQPLDAIVDLPRLGWPAPTGLLPGLTDFERKICFQSFFMLVTEWSLVITSVVAAAAKDAAIAALKEVACGTPIADSGRQCAVRSLRHQRSSHPSAPISRRMCLITDMPSSGSPPAELSTMAGTSCSTKAPMRSSCTTIGADRTVPLDVLIG
jgi:hypothetical protein